jgi:hypothetical protein
MMSSNKEKRDDDSLLRQRAPHIHFNTISFMFYVFLGGLPAPDDTVMLIETSPDVKKCLLISDDITTSEIIMVQYLCPHACRKLRSKLFQVSGLPVICLVSDVGFSEELCGQSFTASVIPHLLRRSTSLHSV